MHCALSFVLGTKKSKNPQPSMQVVLMEECSYSKALEVIILEINASLHSSPMGYLLLDYRRGKGGSQEEMAVNRATCQMCFHPTLI